MLCKQCVAWNCNSSSVAPLTAYTNNPIFQELPDEDKCFDARHDDRIYLDLRASLGYVKEAEKLKGNDSRINLPITLKAAAKYKMRVRI